MPSSLAACPFCQIIDKHFHGSLAYVPKSRDCPSLEIASTTGTHFILGDETQLATASVQSHHKQQCAFVKASMSCMTWKQDASAALVL